MTHKIPRVAGGHARRFPATSGEHARRLHGSRRGFTLIELLLTMGMIAMLTLSLFVALYSTTRARLSFNEQTAGVRQAQVVLDLIEQDFRSVEPPSGTLAGAFTGSGGAAGDTPAATVDFYTIGSDFGQTDTPAGEGTRHVTLYMLGDADGTLERDVTRNPLSSSQQLDPQVLAKNVVGFGVQYFDGQNWTDSWDSASQNTALPLAVEVTVSIKTPTRNDANAVYKASRIIPLSCGRTADAAQADADAASGTSTDSSTTGGTQ